MQTLRACFLALSCVTTATTPIATGKPDEHGHELQLSSDSSAVHSTVRLQEALDAAIERGDPTFFITGGLYRFANNTSFLVHGAARLSILAPASVQLVFSGSAGVSFVNSSDVSIGNVTIDYDPPPTQKLSSITYALVNCSNVVSENITIRAAPFMAVSAFGGEGNHTFRRLHFEPHTQSVLVSQADAVHFSDLRTGPTFEDCSIGHCGDDFFNFKTTIHLLLQCDSPCSCVIVNPHVSGEQPIPFGGNSVLATVRAGDHFSFFGWPQSDMIMPLLAGRGSSGGDGNGGERPNNTREKDGGVQVLTRSRLLPASEPALEAAAALLEKSLVGSGWPWTKWTNQTMPFSATELWRVTFAAPGLPDSVWQRPVATHPRTPTLVTVDEICNKGTRLRHNTWTATKSQLGRFKSPGGVIAANRFVGPASRNLEFSALPQWFEGPIRLDGITVHDNTFVAMGTDLLHCGPLCEASCTRDGVQQQCMAVSDSDYPCPGCPNCSSPSPWAQVRAFNNTFVSQ
jgi:hypothetical protein